MTEEQSHILQLLGSEERSGRELRQMLHDAGRRMSGPGFYQRMSVLEREGWVTAETRVVANGLWKIPTRFFRRTRDGHHALAEHATTASAGRPVGGTIPEPA